MTLKQKIGIEDDFLPDEKEGRGELVSGNNEAITIRTIRFEGIDARDEKWLLSLCKLKENSTVTIAQLKKAMDIMIGTDFYANVSYKLSGANQDELYLIAEPKAMSSLNLGLRFDTEEIMAVLLMRHSITGTRFFRSRFAITGRVSESSYARLDYTIENNPLRNFNLSYMVDYKDLDIYHRGKKNYNTTYLHHLAQFGYTDMNWLNFNFRPGYDMNIMIIKIPLLGRSARV